MPVLLASPPDIPELLTLIAWATRIGLAICLGSLVAGGQIAHSPGHGDQANLKGIGIFAVAASVISVSATVVNAVLT